MKILTLYLMTAAIFFVIDAIGLRLMIKPVFERHVAHLFADPFRVGPAALFYLGYVALWAAIEDPDTAADLTSVLCIVGSVFAVLSRYAVNFWNQGLHQGASLSLDKEENVADVFYFPLLVCIAGFVLLFVALVFYRTGTEIRLRRARALLAREART